MIKIGMYDANDFVQEIELDNITWFLHFLWNSEIERWEFGIENANNEQVISGLPILLNEPLTSLYKYLAIPKGDFIAVSLNSLQTINRDSFIDSSAEFVYAI